MSPKAAKRLPLRQRLLPGILRRLRQAGVRIEPFVTVREGVVHLELPDAPDTYHFGFLTSADTEDLLSLEAGASHDEITRWFGDGKLCYGVRDGSRLIAKMWCDLDEFSYPPNYRRLEPDEVYLFAAYTDPAHRGDGLAPLMRAEGYAALRKKGRSRFYSYTDYFNTPARRFKAKLGAREELLRLHIDVLGKWSKTVTLKRCQLPPQVS